MHPSFFNPTNLRDHRRFRPISSEIIIGIIRSAINRSSGPFPVRKLPRCRPVRDFAPSNSLQPDYHDERGCLVTHEVCSIHVQVAWCIRMMPGLPVCWSLFRGHGLVKQQRCAHTALDVLRPTGINVSTLRRLVQRRHAQQR